MPELNGQLAKKRYSETCDETTESGLMRHVVFHRRHKCMEM